MQRVYLLPARCTTVLEYYVEKDEKVYGIYNTVAPKMPTQRACKLFYLVIWSLSARQPVQRFPILRVSGQQTLPSARLADVCTSTNGGGSRKLRPVSINMLPHLTTPMPISRKPASHNVVNCISDRG